MNEEEEDFISLDSTSKLEKLLQKIKLSSKVINFS